MKLRISVRAVLPALLVFVVTACTDRQSEPDIVLLLMKTSDNPFFHAIEQGTRNELMADSPSVQLVVRAGLKEGDVSTQRQALQSAYIQWIAQSQRPRLRGVLLTPAGSRGELAAEIARLRSAGVPVVLLDTKIADDALRAQGTSVNTFIGSDNHAGGEMAARFTASLPGVKRVLLLNGVDGQETAEARRAGFLAQARANGLDVTERTCNWRRDEARLTVATLLTRGRSFDAIFAANDEMALGAADALNAASSMRIPVIGFDATPEARLKVRDGVLTATIAQDPEAMGRQGVQALRTLWSKGNLPTEVAIPLRLVTADSVAKDGI